jgi:hypothetical protein
MIVKNELDRMIDENELDIKTGEYQLDRMVVKN